MKMTYLLGWWQYEVTNDNRHHHQIHINHWWKSSYILSILKILILVRISHSRWRWCRSRGVYRQGWWCWGLLALKCTQDTFQLVEGGQRGITVDNLTPLPPTPQKRISLGQLEEDGGKRWKRKELPGAGCWRRYAPLPSCWFSDENWKTSKSRNQIFTLLLSRSVGESEGREGAGEREEERRHSSPYSGASLHSGADGRTLWSSPSLGVTDASQAHTAPPYTTSLHSSSTFKSFQATNIMLRNPTQCAPCFLEI